MNNKIKKLFGMLLAGGMLIAGAAVFGIATTINKEDEAIQTSAWSTPVASTAGNYYSPITDSMSGSALQSALKNDLVKVSNTSRSYDWSRYEAADEAQDDSSAIFCVYTRHNIPKSGHCGSYSWNTWNREHVWTQSKYPASDEDNHNIYACEGQINNYRGNLPYNEVTHNDSTRQKVFGHTLDCYIEGGEFEPPDDAKGEIARAVMYGVVNYDYTMTNMIPYHIALKWNLEHPVTDRDMYRNNKVHQLQGNRNPFIDHPEYACRIWGSTNSQTQSVCNSASPTPSVTLNTASASLAVEETVQLTATIHNGSGTISWVSSDPNVASVSANSGSTITVTANAEGTATITASVTIESVTYPASCTVTVSDSGGEQPGETEYSTGFESFSTYNDYNNTELRTFSSNTDAATWKTYYGTVSTTNALTGSKSMQMRYYSSATSNRGYTYTDTAFSNISNIEFKYKVSNTALKIDVSYSSNGGTSWTLFDTITPGSTSATTYSKAIGQTISNFKLKIGVSSSSGAPGSGNYSLIIDDVVLSGAATPTTPTLVAIDAADYTYDYNVGDTFSFDGTVTATYSDDSQQVVTPTNVSSPDMTYDHSEKITISYTEGGVTQTCQVWINVNAVTPTVTSVTVSPSSLSLDLNGTTTGNLSATVTGTNDPAQTVTWESDDESIATVTDAGVVTAVAVGSTTITAKSTVDTTKSGTCTVSVADTTPTGGDEEYFKKVSTISTGTYLIVCESQNVAFNGALSTLDATNNNISVSISNNQIEASTTTLGASFTIDTMTGGYSIKSASNLYIGRTTTNNGLNTSASAILNTISISNGNAAITSSSTTLKYNNGNNQNRFRYYTNGQLDIQLYKLNESSGGSTPEKVLSGITATYNGSDIYVGDTLDESKITVTATYTEPGTYPSEEVTGFTVTGFDSTVAGTNQITISYGGKTANINLTILEQVTPPVNPEYTLSSGSPFMNGVPYRMYFSNGANYYFTGAMDGYYGATSTTIGDAVDVYFEDATGGQNIYIKSGNNNLYFKVVTSGTYTNFVFEGNTTAPATPWTYDSDNQTMKFGTYYIGSRQSYTTIGAYNYCPSWKIQFVTNPSKGAEGFATAVLDAIQCDASGKDAPTFKKNFTWSGFEDVYNHLDDTSKGALRGASRNEEGTIIEQFAARYDTIINKYNKVSVVYKNFINRTTNGARIVPLFNDSKTPIVIILMVSVLSITIIGTLFIVRRKRD